jgi:hypothetical protein
MTTASTHHTEAHKKNMHKQATLCHAELLYENVRRDEHPEQWFPLTFRVDSFIRNAQNIAQSPWSQNPTHAYSLVRRALEWAITELRRHHKGLPFVAWVGGNEAVGIRTHIHAVVRVPDNVKASVFVERLQAIWRRNLAKTLKTEVKASVWIDEESLRSGSLFSRYASRSEAGDSVRGMDKVIVDKSLYLKPIAT